MIESICAIGFSGHRELPDPERVREKISGLLDELERKALGRLIAISSVAMGSDLIFVENCLARGFPWIAILPMPPSLFFAEKDFPDAKIRAQAMALLEKAVSIEITNPFNEEDSEESYRHVAFSDSGQRIVDQCDVFIGVLRPSGDPLKPGGTGEIVRNVKYSKRPLAVINPDDGGIEHHHWHPTFVGEMIVKFRSLPEAPLRNEFLTAESSAQRRAVVDWFSRLSAAARRSVPRLRSLSSTAVILHGLAVILALGLITLPWLFPGAWHHLADWFKVVLAGAAFVATIWFIFGRPHARAARYRLGAEICRSLIATWAVPETHREIFRGLPAEYRGFVRMLLNFRSLEGSKQVQPNNETGSMEAWKEFRTHYQKTRIGKQLDYYTNERKKARRRLNVLEPLTWLCSVGGLLLVTALAIASSRGYDGDGHLAGYVDFGKVAFPFLAGTLVALVAVHEATRRKARYAEMIEILRENAERLESATHKTAVCEAVIDNERALLGENVEWANIAKYPAAS